LRISLRVYLLLTYKASSKVSAEGVQVKGEGKVVLVLN